MFFCGSEWAAPLDTEGKEAIHREEGGAVGDGQACLYGWWWREQEWPTRAIRRWKRDVARTHPEPSLSLSLSLLFLPIDPPILCPLSVPSPFSLLPSLPHFHARSHNILSWIFHLCTLLTFFSPTLFFFFFTHQPPVAEFDRSSIFHFNRDDISFTTGTWKVAFALQLPQSVCQRAASITHTNIYIYIYKSERVMSWR